MDPPPEKKKPITEEERLALAAKLDAELEDYMASLPKRQQPQQPAPFDQWQDEILNHPFFMKELPQDSNAPLHPLYEGLQKLKYDPNENEPLELATSYKDDGNFHFKHKKYRMAVISYTEGLNAKCDDVDLNAQLYNNRAAAQFHLGNYRSCRLDCEKALKLDEGYAKARFMLVKCCMRLEKYDQARDECDILLRKDKSNRAIFELRQDAVNKLKLKERNARKREQVERKRELQEDGVVSEIRKRGIRIKGGIDALTLSKLEPQFPQLYNSRVYVNAEQRLVWPCVLFYPEYKIMDYIREFDEQVTIKQQLDVVFDTTPEWDRLGAYKPGNLNVYYENVQREIVKVDLDWSFLQVLQRKDFLVKEGGTPSLVVLVRGSPAEAKFIES